MTSLRLSLGLALGALLAAGSPLIAQGASRAEQPRTRAARPTAAAITAADLMSRLYPFADDSMMGRDVGTEYHLKATAYLAAEARRLGLQPAGDSGTYFQNLPVFASFSDSGSTISIGGAPLAMGADFLPVVGSPRTQNLDGLAVVYGGLASDTTTWPTAESVAGKVVVLALPQGAQLRSVQFAPSSRFGRAAVVLVGALDRVPPPLARALTRTVRLAPTTPVTVTSPVTVLVHPRVLVSLFGAETSTTGTTVGVAGTPVTGSLVLRQSPVPARNVIALLPGSDPTLKAQYVAIGAHNDHVGYNHAPVDHDSVRVFNMIARVQGADSPAPRTLTAEQTSAIRRMTDSLRALHGGARADSIYNGADDDGSGSVAVLEIAEWFARSAARPKRSLLFVWHAAEEKGLWGASHFTVNSTVPRDSIVAQLNMDMVGRGGAGDVTGETKDGALTKGGRGYVQLVGSRRLSTELGDLFESTNTADKLGMRFDYSMDANGHPQNIYCRSDHYEYAKFGIPIVFVTTGGHSDYHQVTDESQYIDFDRMAQVATLVKNVAMRVANLDRRVAVDKPKPDPNGRCVQ